MTQRKTVVQVCSKEDGESALHTIEQQLLASGVAQNDVAGHLAAEV